MDDKEREKVIEAVRKWTEKKGIDFGHGWDAEIADFHLAETKELRRQLQEANEVAKQAQYLGAHGAARAYLDKWRVE